MAKKPTRKPTPAAKAATKPKKNRNAFNLTLPEELHPRVSAHRERLKSRLGISVSRSQAIESLVRVGLEHEEKASA